jgi:hypothetical protein
VKSDSACPSFIVFLEHYRMFTSLADTIVGVDTAGRVFGLANDKKFARLMIRTYRNLHPETVDSPP